jgi:hypothetical protein
MGQLNTNEYTDDDYEKDKSVVLALETLNMEYKNLLNSYKQAVATYVSYLKEQKKDPDYWVTQGQSYWGTDSIKVTNSPTLQECSASCSSTSGCSGATFNKDDYERPMCWLRSGEGNLVPSAENDYAIIPKGEKLLKIIEYINLELTSVNEKIQQIINSSNDIYNNQVEERQMKSLELSEQYEILMSDRDKIMRIIDEYKTLDETQNNQNIMTTQNYYWYILLLFCLIIFVYILYRISLPQNSETNININNYKLNINPFYVIFGIIIIIIIIYFYNKYFSV